MDKQNEVAEWIKIANEDFSSALFLKGMMPIPFEIICFHCQQCAEKYLKAYLVEQEQLITKTHNLDLVLKQCLSIDKKFVDLKKQCIRLTDYAVDVRYPYRLELDEKLTDLALEDADTIKTFVSAILKS